MVGHNSIIRGDGKISLDGKTNAKAYDAMASEYDEQIMTWGYEAPVQAVRLLAKFLPAFKTAEILDCGCGTGMNGAALRAAGARGMLTGLDVSEASLEIAGAKKVYDKLTTADLNQLLAIDDNSVDGVLCVGVLTYVHEERLLREWKRVIKSGGVVVFTSRTDFFESRKFSDTLAVLEAQGNWSNLHISARMPYLANHPEFADDIQVIYAVCRIG